MSYLAPSALITCNWMTFGGTKKSIVFQLSSSLRFAFCDKFGHKGMTFALNSMMDHFVTRPEEFNTVINDYMAKVYDAKTPMEKAYGEYLVKMVSITNGSYSNKFQCNVSETLYYKFMDMFYPIFYKLNKNEHGEYSDMIGLDDVLNFLLLYAMHARN